jgi:hypothetical protein
MNRAQQVMSVDKIHNGYTKSRPYPLKKKCLNYLTKIHYSYPPRIANTHGVLISTNITIDMIILFTKINTKYKILKSHTSSILKDTKIYYFCANMTNSSNLT